MAAGYHIAQLNIARMRAPLEHPSMRGFTDRLEEINQLADAAPGFVWRLQTEEGDATALRAFDDPDMLINLSVWESIEALRFFTYRGEHRDLLRDRAAWFPQLRTAHLVLWWVPAGHIPSLEEAKERLEKLKTDGPGPEAFTFAERFDPPQP